jgi:chemotaxis protein MotA
MLRGDICKGCAKSLKADVRAPIRGRAAPNRQHLAADRQSSLPVPPSLAAQPQLARLLLNTGAMIIDTASLLIFFDPIALAIVGGGTLLATAARGPLADTVNAIRALPVLVRRPFDFGPARAELAGAERVAHAKSLLAIDPQLLRDPDVAKGVEAVADGATADEVERLLIRLRQDRHERHAVVQDFWAAAAEAAPAMGMVGTLVGLVRMFRSMDDPATIGGAMAIALLATLYGALFANLIAAPIAARLRRLARAEENERRALVKPFRAFAMRETPIKRSRAA